MARCDKNTSDEEVLRIIRGARVAYAERKVRDEDGDVKTAPPNIKCQPMKTNIIDAVHIFPWMPDSDTGEISKAELMKQARKAALEATDVRPPFRPTRPMQTNIIDAVDHYPWMPESDDVGGPTMQEKLKARREAAEKDDAPSPWRPSNPMKSSIFDMSSKFPEHIPCSDAVPQRVKIDSSDAQPAFKPVGRMQSRPVYSVALNKRNLGAYKPSFYRNAAVSMASRRK